MMIISIQKLQRRKISTDSRLREQPFSNVIWKVAEIFSAAKMRICWSKNIIIYIETSVRNGRCFSFVKEQRCSFFVSNFRRR